MHLQGLENEVNSEFAVNLDRYNLRLEFANMITTSEKWLNLKFHGFS